MFYFAIRNLQLFFKDKGAVFLAFLAQLIVVGLYILFMRKNLLESFPALPQAERIMDSWMIAGLLGIAPVTTTMGAFGIMVEDRGRDIQRDFVSSPVSRVSLFSGYLLGAVAVSLLLSVALFLGARLYLLHAYQMRLETETVMKVYGLLIFNAMSSASMVLLLVSFIKSNHALVSCCTILGSLIGFLTGIYLPVGSLPEEVQCLIKAFPISHGVALFRQLLLMPFWEKGFAGEETQAAQQFKAFMGVEYAVGDRRISPTESVLILGIGALVCFFLAVVREEQEVN